MKNAENIAVIQNTPQIIELLKNINEVLTKTINAKCLPTDLQTQVNNLQQNTQTIINTIHDPKYEDYWLCL